MSNREFRAWKRKGVFKSSENRILQVSNNIAEGEHDAYTKREAAEVAVYWSLSHQAAMDKMAMMRSGALLKAATELFKSAARSEKRRKG